jgi:glycosyltransferase involved in cell wall biosynthesis
VRILYLIDSLIAGGAERSLAALAPEYTRLGVELEVAYLYERDNVWLPPLRDAGIVVHSIAGTHGWPGLVRRTSKLVTETKPDILHTTLFDADIVGRVASLAKSVPVVCSLVNSAYGPDQYANPKIRNWKLRTAQLADAVTARRVARFHAVSASVAEEMSGRLRVARQKIDVIPRGRDANELGRRTPERRADARGRLHVADDEPLVLAIGRHEYQKGFDVLLDAFARSDANARLVIAGRDGTETAALRARQHDLGLTSVDFVGFRDDVPDLLCAADLFVSSSRWEGSPGGILEAMALETPIVGTDIASIREVLDETETDGLVPVDDAKTLAMAIDRALECGPNEARLSAARTHFLDSFTIERIANEMILFYERAVSDNRSRA